jgi:hypothetical protein
MPAAYNQEHAPVIGQDLAWDNTGQQYVCVNVTVNLPPGYQQQQQPGQMQVLARPMQSAGLQQWHVSSPVSEQQQMHLQLQPQQMQHSPVAQSGLAWTNLEQRPDQIPFWQSPQAVAGAEAAAGHSRVVAAALPAVQHVQLQQGTLVQAQPQQPSGVLQLQPQLQTQVLHYVPQQQQLQEAPAYALILLPPGASVIDPQQQQQQQLLQPVIVQQELLAQPLAMAAVPGMPAAPQAAHRKTRRGPNRGRSKQKKAEQQAAAESGKSGAAAEPGSLQEGEQQQKPGRFTSDSSSSGPTADASSCSGSGNSESQGGSADSASAAEAGAGSPQKKRVRRRGRRGKKDGLQDTAGDSHEQQQQQGDGQGEGQASVEPLLPEGASAAGAVAAGSAVIKQQQAGASSSAAGQAGAAQQQQQQQQQQAKRTSGLSHRQRYRRKQWELHRAMEQQRAEAEAQAQLQAQQLLLMQQGGARVQVLATPQQMPAMWQELPGGQIAAVQQLQGSPLPPAVSVGMVPAGQMLGSPGAGASMPGVVSAAVPVEAQRVQLLAAAAAAAGVHSDAAGLAAAAGAEQAAGPSWVSGAQQQQQQLEGHAAEGATHVDQNLDEWLSKLLEL